MRQLVPIVGGGGGLDIKIGGKSFLDHEKHVQFQYDNNNLETPY